MKAVDTIERGAVARIREEHLEKSLRRRSGLFFVVLIRIHGPDTAKKYRG